MLSIGNTISSSTTTAIVGAGDVMLPTTGLWPGLTIRIINSGSADATVKAANSGADGTVAAGAMGIATCRGSEWVMRVVGANGSN